MRNFIEQALRSDRFPARWLKKRSGEVSWGGHKVPGWVPGWRRSALLVCVLFAHGIVPRSAAALPERPSPQKASKELVAVLSSGKKLRVSLARSPSSDEVAVAFAGRAARRISVGQPLAALRKLEPVSVGRDTLAVLRANGPSDAQIAIVLRVDSKVPQLLFAGREDLHGDRDARRRFEVSLRDRTGDGKPDLVIGERGTQHHLCSSRTPLLFPTGYDPASHRLRPLVLPRVRKSDASHALEAPRRIGNASGLTLPWLTAQAASSRLGQPNRVGEIGRPGEASDGDTKTAWVEGRGGPGTWEFVRFAVEGGGRFKTQGLRVVPIPEGTRFEKSWQPPAALYVFVSGARGKAGDVKPYRVSLPSDLKPGETVEVALPKPAALSCVAVMLGEPRARAKSRAAARSGVADVALITEVEKTQDLGPLLASIEARDVHAEAALRVLRRAGPKVYALLQAALPKLSVRAQLFVLPLLLDHRPTELSETMVASMLASAAASKTLPADEAERVKELLVARPAWRPLLKSLADKGGRLGKNAALAYVESEREAALPWLLAGFKETDKERTMAERAELVALSRPAESNPDWDGTLARWARGVSAASSALSSSGPLSAKGSGRVCAHLLYALAKADDHHPASAPWSELLFDCATKAASHSFAYRYRVVAGTSIVPVHGRVRDWLRREATAKAPWMIRARALEVLARARALDRNTVRRGLRDRYPRVRSAALSALAQGHRVGVRIGVLRSVYQKERWPMVRRVMVDVLAQRGAWDDVVASLRDPAARVRQAALRALREKKVAAAKSAVLAHFSAEKDSSVLLESVLYIEALCIKEATPQLKALFALGTEQGADPDTVLAAREARRALIRFGDTSVLRDGEKPPAAPMCK